MSHVRHTLRLSPTTEDKDIYQKATEEKRHVVTIDDDFKKLVKPKKAGVIIIPSELSNEDIEKELLKFISGKNPEDSYGKVVKITALD